jgi:hypothetical protein
MPKKPKPIINKKRLLDRKAVQERLTSVLTKLGDYYGGEEHILDKEVQRQQNMEPGVLGDLKALMWARGQLEVYQEFQD